MKSVLPYFFMVIWIAVCLSCQGDDTTLAENQTIDPDREIASDVEMIFSDSARLQFIIRTPRLEKYEEKKVTVEEFPQGIHIDFYDQNGDVTTTIYARYAERRSAKGTMLLRDSVVLTNPSHDQLTTIGILWDEQRHTLKTSKFIRLIKGSTLDTLYGWGMDASDDFSRFHIKRLTARRYYKSDSIE